MFLGRVSYMIKYRVWKRGEEEFEVNFVIYYSFLGKGCEKNFFFCGLWIFWVRIIFRWGFWKR